jgi:hypothetical protein
MRNSTPVVQTANSLPNLVDDANEQNEWSCSMCTFLNYPLLNQCEQCDMPRVHQGINITRSSFRPLNFENNQMQRSVSANNSSGNSTMNSDNARTNNINQFVENNASAL